VFVLFDALCCRYAAAIALEAGNKAMDALEMERLRVGTGADSGSTGDGLSPFSLDVGLARGLARALPIAEAALRRLGAWSISEAAESGAPSSLAPGGGSVDDDGSGSGPLDRVHAAAHGAPVLHCIGHAHIDCAWLWPYAETVRKIARTLASQLAIAEADTGARGTFALSQVWQLAAVREAHPALFARLRAAVRAGRVEIVGSTWVEMDGNLPSTESFIRQFVVGQSWLAEHLLDGAICETLWLPDTFGYAAQLPQIARLAGCGAFVSNKLSWNQFNRFPFHTFQWCAPDGTAVLAHFSPVEDYNALVTVADLLAASTAACDVPFGAVPTPGTSDLSLGPFRDALLLFGFGDGGGGPAAGHYARIERLARLPGMPVLTTHTSVRELIARLMAQAAPGGSGPQLPTWDGEIYLEFHRGTLVTHAAIKSGNRRAEGALRACEALCVMAALTQLWLGAQNSAPPGAPFEYPYARLRRVWEAVLLNQFHDVLPGTSTTAVMADALARLDSALRDTALIQAEAVECLLRTGVSIPGCAVINTGGGRSVTDPAPGTVAVYNDVDPFGCVRVSDDNDADRQLQWQLWQQWQQQQQDHEQQQQDHEHQQQDHEHQHQQQQQQASRSGSGNTSTATVPTTTPELARHLSVAAVSEFCAPSSDHQSPIAPDPGATCAPTATLREPSGLCECAPTATFDPATGATTLRNAYLIATVTRTGAISDLRTTAPGARNIARAATAGSGSGSGGGRTGSGRTGSGSSGSGGGMHVYTLSPDCPVEYDAWDVDAFSAANGIEIPGECMGIVEGDGWVGVEMLYRLGGGRGSGYGTGSSGTGTGNDSTTGTGNDSTTGTSNDSSTGTGTGTSDGSSTGHGTSTGSATPSTLRVTLRLLRSGHALEIHARCDWRIEHALLKVSFETAIARGGVLLSEGACGCVAAWQCGSASGRLDQNSPCLSV
jgi:hypothetical protein